MPRIRALAKRLAAAAVPLILAAAGAAPCGAIDGDFDPTFDGDCLFRYTSPGSYGHSLLRAPDDAVVAWGTRVEATSASEIHWRRIELGGAGTLCTFTPPGATFLGARAAAFDTSGRLL